MTRSSLALSGQDTRRGSLTGTENCSEKRRMMKMCRKRIGKFNPAWRADAERYRRYAEAKARIPMDLPPQEFTERVKALAKKYHI